MIRLDYWDYTCGDGCCYTTGYDVFVDGQKIGQIDEDAEALAMLLNEYFENNKTSAAELK